MTLDNIVSNSLKGAVAAGLLAGGLAYSKPVSAQEPPWLGASAPESVCSERYEVMFSSGFADLSLITPIGLQDCSSLDNYFDDDLEDDVPLVVSLDADQTFHHAVLRSLSDESTKGDYLALALDGNGDQVPLPDWASFDSEYGVFSGSPSCADAGVYSVEFNIAPNDLPGSITPLLVDYQVSCPASFSISGLDFENNGEVSGNPHFGTWADANSDGVIDQPVQVSQGRNLFNPWEAYVLSPDKNVELINQGTKPSYITLSGNMIEFGQGGLEGESGTLDLLVCDTATPTDCTNLQVPWEYVHPDPQIVGLSYSQQNGTIDNPANGAFFDEINDVACTISGFDRRYVVAEPYDFEYSFDISNPAPNMGINSDGAIVFNPDCDTQVGQTYFPSVQVIGSGGQSNWKTARYDVTNGVNVADFKSYK